MEENLYYQSGVEIVSFSDFEDFIKSVEGDFLPPLLARVNIEEYYNKLNANAAFVVCRNDSQIVGMIVFYCNDLEHKKSYVTLMAVRKEWRRHKIALHLLSDAFAYCRAESMKHIGIHTNSPVARSLYIKAGFEDLEATFLPEYKINRHYLEKKL